MEEILDFPDKVSKISSLQSIQSYVYNNSPIAGSNGEDGIVQPGQGERYAMTLLFRNFLGLSIDERPISNPYKLTPELITAVQAKLGEAQDGFIGMNTINALAHQYGGDDLQPIPVGY